MFSAIVLLHQLYLYLNYFQKSLPVYSILTYLFGNSCVQIFFSDFSKGFDMLDYHYTYRRTPLLGVEPVLSDWIKSVFSDQ